MNSTWVQPPSTAMRLSSSDVHVWRVSLDLPAPRVRELWGTLSEDERQRAGRFVFERHRRRYIAARGMLRKLLSRYLDVAPAGLKFGYGRLGKPNLITGSVRERLNFNLSHSHEIALYAIARDRAIGVDVERIRADYPYEQVADRFFASQERATLRLLPDRSRAEAFFLCWTRKEAYIKARGDGLSYPLEQFTVSLIPGEPAALVSADDGMQENQRWSLVDLRPAAGYVAALAVEGEGCRLSSFSAEGMTELATARSSGGTSQ